MPRSSAPSPPVCSALLAVQLRADSGPFAEKGVPVVVTHDARTIRYPDPSIKVGDTVKIDLKTGKIVDFIKFNTGTQVLVTGGRNTGRVGTLVHNEKHDGNFDIVHVKDATGHEVCSKKNIHPS